jgi:hypothetical protein
LAYNANVDQITVGWMTKESTTVIPLTNDVKYVAEYIKDAGTGAPSAIPTSFMMISNQPGGPAPVLAFSGQNAVSGYNGLYAAYSQYNTYFAGNYCMVYKSKPWSSGTFKMLDNEEGIVSANNADITFYPVPFINSLNFAVPAKGDYQISIVNIEGKVVSSLNETLDVNQKISINTENLVSGIYFVRVISKENDINITRKVVK